MCFFYANNTFHIYVCVLIDVILCSVCREVITQMKKKGTIIRPVSWDCRTRCVKSPKDIRQKCALHLITSRHKCSLCVFEQFC